MSCPKIFLSAAVCVLLHGQLASCYGLYQERIPNVGLASRIPVPVNQGINLAGIEVTETGRFCQSVGHVSNCDGPPPGGDGNPFGRDFNTPRFGGTFDQTVCRMDSDGDTYTNGDELGDPDCVFEATGIANRTTCLSHPGFPCSTPCDPFCVGMTTNAECPGCAPTTSPPPPPPTTTTPPFDTTTPPATTAPPPPPITTTPPFDTTTPPATTAPPPPPPITTPPPPINITGAPTGSPPPPPITTPPPFMDLTNTPTPPPPATTPPPVVTFPRPVFPLEQTCPEAIQSNGIASYATCSERLNGQTRLLYEEFVASCAARPTCMLQ